MKNNEKTKKSYIGQYIQKLNIGFVHVDELVDDDILIRESDSNNAMDGDIVEVKVYSTSRIRKIGKITKIIQRNTEELLGVVEKSKTFAFVVPRSNKIKGDVYLSKKEAKKVKDGDNVIIELQSYGNGNKHAEGKIVKNLGKANENELDFQSLILQYKLRSTFNEKVLKEAQEVAKEVITPEGRLDLRKEEVFTIDAKTAKDLDDAVNVKKNGDGTYTLGVHIADVSHYVKEGSQLDKEAIKRATSVYMLNKVIPMLPEILSNGVCSLNAGEDRYAISCIMTINDKGRIVDSIIKKSIINVTKKMNYDDVELVTTRNEIDEKDLSDEDRKILEENKKYEEHLDNLKELAIILKDRRIRDGYLSLEIPETKIEYNEEGKAINVTADSRKFSYEIIEQFMLTANEVVAETFFYLDSPFIYRCHEAPEADKVRDTKKELWNLGYTLRANPEDIRPKSFQELLNSARTAQDKRMISNLILHTLKIAKYEATNLGHFGIASNYYAHFTSPIRRYPDLFVHRMITYHIDNNYMIPEKIVEEEKNKSIVYAQQSTDREQVATKCERESVALKCAEYMETKIGEEFEGRVVSVVNFGIFVELENTIQGLVRLDAIKDDKYYYNESKKMLVGEMTNKTYKMGDKVKIVVMAASKEARTVDFMIPKKTKKSNNKNNKSYKTNNKKKEKRKDKK